MLNNHPELVLALFIYALGLVSCSGTKTQDKNKNNQEIWLDFNYSDSVYQSIQKPVIAAQTFFVKDYGVIPGTDADMASGINLAIEETSKNGGGTLIIPKGTYYSGRIILKSNVHLYFEEGAEIIFIPDPELYPNELIWYKGVPCYNYSPFIYAKDAHNIKISGKGILNGSGNANAWLELKKREAADWDLLHEFYEENIELKHRVFGNGSALLPDLMSFIECSVISISDIKVKNIPFYGIHPVLSNQISLAYIDISGSTQPSIGIAPESCENVVMNNISVKGVSDGIEIRAGHEAPPVSKTAQNIIIDNCSLEDISRNAIGIGIDIRAGVERVFLRDVSINKAKRAIAIFTDTYRGTYVQHIYADNISVNNVWDQVLYANVFHGSNRLKPPTFSYMRFNRITADSSGRAFYFEGAMENKMRFLEIRKSSFRTFQKPFGEDIQRLLLDSVIINGELYDAAFSFGDTEIEEFDQKPTLNEKVLDSDNMTLDRVPKPVQKTIRQFNLPQEDIDRKITRNGVYYEVDFKQLDGSELEIMIGNSGEIVRSEKLTALDSLPKNVSSAFAEITNSPAIQPVIKKIKRIDVERFTYYQIEAEDLLYRYLLELSHDGAVIEVKKQPVIYGFPASANVIK